MLSQTAEYALRAMAWLALSPRELVSTVLLAEHTKVPPQYLAKVLQQLAGAGLIKGRRGVGGGYMLARPATEITLLDVISVVAPVERIDTCPLGIPGHCPTLCPLHRRVDAAAKAVIDVFSGATLQDLVDDPDHLRPLCGNNNGHAADGDAVVAEPAAVEEMAAGSNGAPVQQA